MSINDRHSFLSNYIYPITNTSLLNFLKTLKRISYGPSLLEPYQKNSSNDIPEKAFCSSHTALYSNLF